MIRHASFLPLWQRFSVIKKGELQLVKLPVCQETETKWTRILCWGCQVQSCDHVSRDFLIYLQSDQVSVVVPAG